MPLLEPEHFPDLIDIAASLGKSLGNCSPRAWAWGSARPVLSPCSRRFGESFFFASLENTTIALVATDATLTSKGQTTIPKEIRDSLGLQPGDRMIFTLMPDGTVVLRVKTRSVMDLAGLLRKKGRKPVAIARLSR